MVFTERQSRSNNWGVEAEALSSSLSPHQAWEIPEPDVLRYDNQRSAVRKAMAVLITASLSFVSIPILAAPLALLIPTPAIALTVTTIDVPEAIATSAHGISPGGKVVGDYVVPHICSLSNTCRG